MYEIFKGDKGRDIRTWLPTAEMEPQAMSQLMAAAGHPRLGSHIAVMPDCHLGVGVTIGCVLPTVEAVIPNAVGVDIGCGMTYVKTGIALHEAMQNEAFWTAWAVRVRDTVPMGFNAHKYEKSLGPQLSGKLLYAEELNRFIETKAVYQIGTLGGGNHFLEAQVTADGYVAFMVHSGSRHIGLQIANYYNAKALEENARTRVLVPRDLAYLDSYGDTYHMYLADMAWALTYAYESRDRMLHKLVNAFEDAMTEFSIPHADTWNPLTVLNVHHNYAEVNVGEGIVLHRKGATYAGNGVLGIIPGSMGAKSYIVRGKGNPDSFWSCSHGAGRQMSRGAAKRALTLQDFQDSVTGTYSPVSLAYIDEAPGAYKDIDRVMEQQADLVEIVDTLSPIMTLKGSSKAKDD